MPRTGRPPVEASIRFWRQVRKTKTCWLWTGYLGSHGYGYFRPNGRYAPSTRVHRYSYVLHYGAIPEGLLVCHRCNVKGCVRPDHLYLGTPWSNTDQAVRDGLMARGERHGRTRLTTADVREIRRAQAERVQTTALALRYGVSYQTIWRITRRMVWQHV